MPASPALSAQRDVIRESLRIAGEKVSRDRTIEIRETPEFVKIAHRVRMGLRAGHSYDE